jgi:two-component system sensor histidine kinase YesM
MAIPRLRSIRSKLILMFFGVASLPLLALGAAAPLLFGHTVERQNTEATLRMIGQVTRGIDTNVRDMEYLIGFLSRDESVVSFLAGQGTAAPGLDRVLGHLKASRPDVAGLLVVGLDGRTASAGLTRVSRDPLAREPWFRQAVDMPERIHLQARPVGRNVRSQEGLSADDVVAVTKAVADAEGHVLGVILVDLRLSAIEGLFAQSTMENGGFLCVADASGNFVWAPPVPAAYRLDANWFAESGRSVVARIGRLRYLILAQRSPYTGWNTVGVFSLTEALREVTVLQYATLGLAFASLVLAVLAALFFTLWFSRPVLALRRTMKQAEEGDLDARFEHGPDDEIGQLGNSFNAMLAEIGVLVEQVRAEQKRQQEAELKTLQAQIKPHFLYNTLDTIQWMAAERGAEDIQTVVGALSDLFRIGLSRGQEMIPLSREFDHIRSYLLIQKTRYENGLEYDIADPGELGPQPVLKLVLQPLVENAIYHGIKEADRPGRVTVTARREGDALVLTVADDGIGMTGDQLQALTARLDDSLAEDSFPDDDSTSGYGVFSVQARIRLSFGADYGLTFRSRLGEGTEVDVRLPAVLQEAP